MENLLIQEDGKNNNNEVKIFNDIDSATLHVYVVGNYFINVPCLSTYLGHFI